MSVPDRFVTEYPARCQQLLEMLEMPAREANLVGSFALLGTLVGTIQRPDWAFLANWLRLRMLRES